MSKKEAKEVIKASAAIHTPNKISFLQRRTWNVLLANAFDDLPIKDEYQVNVKELCGVLGIDKTNSTHVKNSLKGLVDYSIEWNILNKDKTQEWGVASLLAQAKIKNGICTYAYAPELRRRLHNPAMYARISLAIQNKFDSKHSLALYELCVDYFDIKKNYSETPWIDILSFRNLMGLKNNEYSEFKKLNKWIIKNPIEEINKKSDLYADTKYKREKRKVVAVKFCIKRNPNKNNLLNLATFEETQAGQLPPKTEQLTLFDRLERFGLTPEQAKKYSNNYDSNNINQILDKVEDKFKKGEIKNITAYTITSLKNTAPQTKTPIENENKKSIAKTKKELAEQHKLIIEQLEQRFYKHKKDKISEVLSNEIDKNKLFNEFEIKLKKDPSYELIRSLNSPDIIQSLFEDHIANNYLQAEDNSFIKWAKKKGYKIQQKQSGEYVFVN